MITIENKQTIPVDTDTLNSDAKKILDHLGYATFDLGILLCDDATMHEYNKQYRDKDKATDILSFPFYPDLQPGDIIHATEPEEKNLGDIIICPEYVQNDLGQWNQTFDARMRTLLVHGICHLLGYDHIEDADYTIMQAKENELIEMLK